MRRVIKLIGLLIAGASALAIFVFAFGSRQPLPPLSEQADRIVVSKSAHTMTLYRQQHILATYRVALGRGGSEPKSQAGDNRVPEGIFPITNRNIHSAFYRSLHVGYPTEQQRSAASKRGVDPGGDIMIHGIRNGLGWLGASHRAIDWTKGCIAVSDTEMDQIWAAVPNGTPVQIDP